MVRRLPWWAGYVIATGSVAAVTLVRFGLQQAYEQTGIPFLLYDVAIVAGAWSGGFGAGTLATMLSIVSVALFVAEPQSTPHALDREEIFPFVIFALQGLLLAALGESNLRALRRISRLADDMESRVELRTAQLTQANHQLMTEVHERTLAEQRLQVDRNFLAALLESLHDGIVACDATGRITLVNHATREFFGLPPGPIPPDGWVDAFNLLEADGVTPLPPERAPLARVFAENQLNGVEVVAAPQHGPRRSIRVAGRTILDESGRRIGAVVSMQDVTAGVEAERRVRAALAELQRSNKELQDFASVASHDLQEPLRKIQAFGDRLKATQGDRLNDQGRDYLDRMHKAAYRMGVLIEDLLAFSRVTSRAQPFAPVDLAQVTREVIGDLEHRIERTGGRIDIGPLPVIDADATQMRQLIQNLLSNGLKFHRPGLPPVVRIEEVPIEDEAPERWAVIAISDNGIGFDEKYLDRIFSIFQRLHGRGEYEGTGVGLAVCRKIVERHGGRITARSSLGAGATFLVTLPRRQNREQTTHDAQTDHDPAGR